MTFLCSLLSNIVQEYHWVVAHDGSEVEQIGKGEVSRKVAQNQRGTQCAGHLVLIGFVHCLQ